MRDLLFQKDLVGGIEPVSSQPETEFFDAETDRPLANFLRPETRAETRRIAKIPQFIGQINGCATEFGPSELGGGGRSPMRTSLRNQYSKLSLDSLETHFISAKPGEFSHKR